MLALCLKKLKGLSKVRIVDAGFIWTEPHSKRIKVKITIQDSVMDGVLLQQTFEVIYVVSTQQCSECAKSKHSCDLRTPRCSRCIKRRAECVYANEPLTAPEPNVQPSSDASLARSSYRFSSLDPFDSYPQTRLSRDHVQRLIHSCKSSSLTTRGA